MGSYDVLGSNEAKPAVSRPVARRGDVSVVSGRALLGKLSGHVCQGGWEELARGGQSASACISEEGGHSDGYPRCAIDNTRSCHDVESCAVPCWLAMESATWIEWGSAQLLPIADKGYR